MSEKANPEQPRQYHLRVKVCGITRGSDALKAAEHRAEFVGFIFTRKSPRYIDPLVAADIIAALPETTVPVGVFVDAPRDEVLDVISRSGIQIAQLHGSEPPAFCNSFGPFPVMKAFRVKEGFTSDELTPYNCRTFVLDAYHPDKAGGTGETFDWELAKPASAAHRIMLAGGLTPDNVVDAADTVEPWGVDTSSGLEISPGVKDHDLIDKLFANLDYAGYRFPPGWRRQERP